MAVVDTTYFHVLTLEPEFKLLERSSGLRSFTFLMSSRVMDNFEDVCKKNTKK